MNRCKSPVAVEVHKELSSADREMAIAILRRRLLTAVLRKIVDALQERGKRNRKSVEWIVAETERSGSAGGRLRPRLPDNELPGFLLDLTGPDLLWLWLANTPLKATGPSRSPMGTEPCWILHSGSSSR